MLINFPISFVSLVRPKSFIGLVEGRQRKKSRKVDDVVNENNNSSSNNNNNVSANDDLKVENDPLLDAQLKTSTANQQQQ